MIAKRRGIRHPSAIGVHAEYAVSSRRKVFAIRSFYLATHLPQG
jgi:hypothetical protein